MCKFFCTSALPYLSKAKQGILRSYSKKILQIKNKMNFICTFGFFFVTLRPI